MQSMNQKTGKEYFLMYMKGMHKIRRYKILLDELEQIGQLPYAPMVDCDDWTLCGRLLCAHKKQLEQEIQACETICECVVNAVGRLEGVEKEVLLLRYIKMHRWEEIAEKIGYSTTQVHRIHNSAMEKAVLDS